MDKCKLKLSTFLHAYICRRTQTKKEVENNVEFNRSSNNTENFSVKLKCQPLVRGLQRHVLE